MNGITVGVGVGDGNTVGVELGVGEATGVGVAVGDAVGFGAEFATPLFHTSFFPLFTHVYFLPALVEVAPILVQGAPALTAAIALIGAMHKVIATRAPIAFFISEI